MAPKIHGVPVPYLHAPSPGVPHVATACWQPAVASRPPLLATSSRPAASPFDSASVEDPGVDEEDARKGNARKGLA
jgi:hypothetical protein